MKIALVHDYLIKLGGAEKVLQVLHKIYPDAPIYTLLYDQKGTRGIFETDEYTIIPSSLQKKPGFLRKRSKLLLNRFPAAIEEFNFDDYDLVISDSNSFAHGIITGSKTAHICYCYSPTRYLWDWYQEYLAENDISEGPVGRYIRYKLSQLRIWDRNSAERVDFWLAQSKTVAKRIKKYYRKESTVIFPPVNINSIPLNLNKPKDYYLIVSRLTPYKKIDLAIRAFNKLNKKLIIVGEGDDRQRLEILADENIDFIGFQPTPIVNKMMGECKAFIFPGEEDFGLTPVETMAAGRPVIAYNKGGVTETVVAEKTGVFFDQNTPESLIKAVKYFEKKHAKFKPKICRKRTEMFSEEKFIRNIKNFVKQQTRNLK